MKLAGTGRRRLPANPVVNRANPPSPIPASATQPQRVRPNWNNPSYEFLANDVLADRELRQESPAQSHSDKDADSDGEKPRDKLQLLKDWLDNQTFELDNPDDDELEHLPELAGNVEESEQDDGKSEQDTEESEQNIEESEQDIEELAQDDKEPVQHRYNYSHMPLIWVKAFERAAVKRREKAGMDAVGRTRYPYSPGREYVPDNEEEEEEDVQHGAKRRRVWESTAGIDLFCKV